MGTVIYLGTIFATVFAFLAVRKLAAGALLAGVILSALWSLRQLRRGRLHAAVWWFLAPLWAVSAVIMVFGGGTHSQALVPMLVTVVAASLMSGRRAGLAWTAVYLLTTLAMALAEHAGLAPRQYFPIRPVAGWFLLILWVVIAVVPLGDVLRSLNESLARLSATVGDMARTEEALRKSDERFRTIAEQMIHVLLTTDAEGVITYVSPSVWRMFGWLPGELPGRRLTELLAEPSDAVHIESVLSGGGPLRELEMEMKRRDGSRFCTSVNLNATLRDGRVTGTTGLIRDISERLRAQRELREVEARYRDLVDHIPVGIYRSTAGGQVLMANPALCEMLGCRSYDELLRADVGHEFYVEPGRRAENLAILERDGMLRNVELTLRRRDGRVITVLENCRVVRDGAGAEPCYEGTLVDVSERKRAEESLRREQEFTERIIDSVPGIFFALDQNLRYVRWNDLQARLIGLPAERIPRLNPLDRIHEDDRPQVAAALEQVMITGGAEVEARGLVGPGPEVRHFYLTGRLANVDGMPYIVGYGLDITRRKEEESARAKLEAQLLQARKLESIGRLSGGIAHDFNNILTVINGYGELVLAQIGEHPLRAHVEQMVKAGNKAAELTSQLLAFSRKQIVHPRPLELNVVIEDTASMMRRIIGEDIILITRLDPALRTVLADAGQISQVLINLATNARDAMPEGGALVVETGNLAVGAVPDPQLAIAPGDYVVITVTDSGIGMDEATTSQIFEPFFTTKPVGSGTGLGLATVHGIVSQAGGHISVSSKPGRGTTFRICLPAVDAKPVCEPERPPRGARGAETILLVEDQTEVRILLATILAEDGYRMLTAPDGETALRIAKSESTIHLLITDMVMPGMTGRQLAQEMSRVMPATPVLFMSGYTEDEIVRSGGLFPGAQYISKPVSPRDFRDKIRQVLHCSGSLS